MYVGIQPVRLETTMRKRAGGALQALKGGKGLEAKV
jgi:hypothetical protein